MTGSAQLTRERESLQAYPFTQFAAYGMHYKRARTAAEHKHGPSALTLHSCADKRQWRVAHRLSAEELQKLREFYKAHLVEPFHFEDHTTDVACKAVFTGTFLETCRPGYFSVSVELSEVL